MLRVIKINFMVDFGGNLVKFSHTNKLNKTHFISFEGE
jgi:hypothetical protein